MDRKQADLSKLEGYREMRQKFVAGLTPEERIEGLAPIEILRALSAEALDALSPEARAIVRRRLGRS